MELISREELLKQIETDSKGNEGQYGDEWLFIDTINSIPTIEERKEGKWIRAEGELICSICEYPAEFNPLSSDFIETNYCPNCGARMKGE